MTLPSGQGHLRSGDGETEAQRGKAASKATQCASIHYSVNPSLFLIIQAGRVPPPWGPGMLQGN